MASKFKSDDENQNKNRIFEETKMVLELMVSQITLIKYLLTCRTFNFLYFSGRVKREGIELEHYVKKT